MLANSVFINPLSFSISGSTSGPSGSSKPLFEPPELLDDDDDEDDDEEDDDDGLVGGVGDGGLGEGGGDFEFVWSIMERRQKQISRASSCVKNPFSFASYLR